MNIRSISLLLSLFLVSPLALSDDEIQGQKEIGRYQVSTTYRAAGNWVFVTIIDTTTGEIIKQERYSGFKKYEEK